MAGWDGGSRRNRDLGDPQWITKAEAMKPEPAVLFVQTYEAIASSEEERWDGRHLGRLVGWLLGGVALVLVAMAVREALITPASPPGEPIATPRSPAPAVVAAAPVAPKATLGVGESLDFAVTADIGDARFGWMVDGVPAATGPRWTNAPAGNAVGRHRVEVSVIDRRGRTTHDWAVRVRPARPPVIVTARPAGEGVSARSGQAVPPVAARPGAAGERLETRWTVDGAAAGEGESWTFRPSHPGTATVQAIVRGELGGSAVHTWQVAVEEPPPPPPPPPQLVEQTPAAPVAEATPPTAVARATPPTAVARATPPSRNAPPVTRVPPPSGAPPLEEVRRWLDRYAAAWRAHDVDALRRMGQVSTDEQISALRRYFASVPDLDVELDLVAMDVRPDGAVVRFVRRDRFRDPGGRLVEKESPPIEKHLVRTPDGLRLVPPPPA